MDMENIQNASDPIETPSQNTSQPEPVRVKVESEETVCEPERVQDIPEKQPTAKKRVRKQATRAPYTRKRVKTQSVDSKDVVDTAKEARNERDRLRRTRINEVVGEIQGLKKLLASSLKTPAPPPPPAPKKRPAHTRSVPTPRRMNPPLSDSRLAYITRLKNMIA